MSPRPPRPRRAHRAATVVAVVLLAVAGLAGCGVRADHTADAGEGDGAATLPTLPPAEERTPELYDAEGCVVLEDGRDCGVTADELDEALAGDESGRTLAGFSGPLFTTDLSGDALSVLADTVSVVSSGPWRAQGLVRNETTSPALAPTVTAVLRDGAGAELDRVEAEVLVSPLRSGEPAPFVLDSAVDTAAVASVDWSVRDAGGDPRLGTRDLELSVFFTEPAGAREALDTYLYEEQGAGPFPHVLMGSMTVLADVEAPNPTAVAAWLGDDGRVRAIAQAPAVDPSGEPATSLAPGDLADFVLTVEGDAAGLDAAPLLLWGMSA
mgnify:CR=1 FL=1